LGRRELALLGAGGRCYTPVAAYRPAATAVGLVGHYSYRSAAAVGEEDGRTDRGSQCGVTKEFTIQGLHHLILTDRWRHEVAASTTKGHRKGWGCRGKGGERLDSHGEGNRQVGEEVIMAMGDHQARKAVHDGFRLQVEVAEHFVGMPPPKQADDVTIHLQHEQGHSAGGAEAAHSDVGRGKEG